MTFFLLLDLVLEVLDAVSFNAWPTWIKFGFLIPFKLCMVATLTLCSFAIAERVSPFLTV
ncbi:hypothetical protein BSF_18060 [Bacillus subtilis]|nr:hypothetical protein BSF_18060 [Bacillus subtilis]